MTTTGDMELRHLPYPEVLKLSDMLDKTESWKKLMENIPKNLTGDSADESTSADPKARKYSFEEIR